MPKFKPLSSDEAARLDRRTPGGRSTGAGNGEANPRQAALPFDGPPAAAGRDRPSGRQPATNGASAPALTGDLRSRVDQIWNAFWSGGIANPIEVIEQITYLLFLRRLD